jgi:hypothetical protein
MPDSIVTADFSDFGYRELAMAAELLTTLSEGKCPDDFEYDNIKVCMNTYSGNVFLTNDDRQVAMMNGETLESFYSSPYEGKEGFWEELVSEYEEMHPEDQKWMQGIANGRELPDLEEEEEEDEEDEEEEEEEDS